MRSENELKPGEPVAENFTQTHSSGAKPAAARAALVFHLLVLGEWGVVSLEPAIFSVCESEEIAFLANPGIHKFQIQVVGTTFGQSK